jgi:hypothetical protein
MALKSQKYSLRIASRLGSGLLATTSFSLGMGVFSAPAPAAVTGCGQGGVSGQFLYSDITAGFQCYIGDKLYSGFDKFSGMSSNDVFTLFQGGPKNEIYSISVQGGSNGGYFTPGTYGFDYKVSVWQGSQTIQTYSTGATTNVGGVTWQKDLISTGSPTNATATNLTPGGTSDSSTFSPTVTTADFTTKLTVSGGTGVTQWTDALIQTTTPSGNSVPAPLPLLGASAAFAYSRRLRQRTRAKA